MIRSILIASILLRACVGMTATAEDILKTAWKDQDLSSYSEAVGVLSQAQPNNPFAEFQLTFEKGEIDKDSHKFGFRVYPKGVQEFSAYRGYLRALEADEKQLQKEALSQALVKRYNLLSKLALLKAKNQSSKDLANLVERAGRALAYNAQKDRSQIKTFLKAKTDLEKVEMKLAELNRDLAIAEQDLKGLSLSGAKEIDWADLATPADIQQRIAKFDDSKPALTSQKAKLDYDRSLAALQYDRAQENKWLSHLEVSVKDDKREKFYGIEVAFKLPFLSAPDMSSIDKQARLARAKAESNSEASAANQTLFASMAELKALLSLHQSLKEKQAQNDPENIRRASELIAKQDPFLAVELQRGWYESFEQLVDVEAQIRALYITYLHETGALTEDPNVNHLSKSKKRIQQ